MGKLKHGQARRGRKTRTYRLWEAMHRRCNNPSQDSYPLYGGRGIRVCFQWHRYDAFLADMGECPPGYSIDRIDSNGHYEPSNCRWVPMAAQAKNKRNNRPITFNGETKLLTEWASVVGLKWKTLRARLDDHGWTVERALTTPLRGTERT